VPINIIVTAPDRMAMANTSSESRVTHVPVTVTHPAATSIRKTDVIRNLPRSSPKPKSISQSLLMWNPKLAKCLRSRTRPASHM
jgi:hypothetical protein